MCTLTVVPVTGFGYRVAFNRDERPDRPPAAPPERVWTGRRWAVWPTDPASGGTWLAVNDAGLTLALLNVNPPGRLVSPRPISRGRVIPAVLDAGSPFDAVDQVGRAIDLQSVSPFRLVAIGGGTVAEFCWDGRRSAIASQLLGGRPAMFTSSGLGDHHAGPPRERLFHEMLSGRHRASAAAQDAFHRHRWPGREAVSVNMCRADARTVSHAVVEVGRDRAVFRYHPAAPDEPAVTVVRELPLAMPVGTRPAPSPGVE
ncbi:MAG: NRDE family protein [Gemmataceae bacterium]|nr:NRDE family protein [Gemmataceae bacterium]